MAVTIRQNNLLPILAVAIMTIFVEINFALPLLSISKRSGEESPAATMATPPAAASSSEDLHLDWNDIPVPESDDDTFSYMMGQCLPDCYEKFNQCRELAAVERLLSDDEPPMSCDRVQKQCEMGCFADIFKNKPPQAIVDDEEFFLN